MSLVGYAVPDTFKTIMDTELSVSPAVFLSRVLLIHHPSEQREAKFSKKDLSRSLRQVAALHDLPHLLVR